MTKEFTLVMEVKGLLEKIVSGLSSFQKKEL